MNEKTIRKLRYNVLSKYPFYSDLLLRIQIRENDKLPNPMAVRALKDGKIEMAINPIMLKELNFHEQLFCLLHELKHVMLFHTDIFNKHIKSLNEIVYNLATDVIVNELTLTEIDKYCIDYLYQGLATKDKFDELKDLDVLKYTSLEIYEILMKKYKNIIIDFPTPSNNDNLDDLVDKLNDLLDKVDKELSKHNLNDFEKEVIKKAVIDNYLQKTFDNLDEKTKQNLKNEIREAIVNGYAQQKLIGKTAMGMEYIYNQHFRKVRNWKNILKDEIEKEIKNAFTFRKINHVVYALKSAGFKQIGNLPSMDKDYAIPSLTILLDTSGSISDKEYEQFLNEIYSILKTTHIKNINVAMFESEVSKEFSGLANIKKVMDFVKKRKGFGGTDLKVAVKHVLKKKKNVRNTIAVIFTDGYFGKIDVKLLQQFRKVIFVLTENSDVEHVMKLCDGKKIKYLKVK